jgi:hypothetical protein
MPSTWPAVSSHRPVKKIPSKCATSLPRRATHFLASDVLSARHSHRRTPQYAPHTACGLAFSCGERSLLLATNSITRQPPRTAPLLCAPVLYAGLMPRTTFELYAPLPRAGQNIYIDIRTPSAILAQAASRRNPPSALSAHHLHTAPPVRALADRDPSSPRCFCIMNRLAPPPRYPNIRRFLQHAGRRRRCARRAMSAARLPIIVQFWNYGSRIRGELVPTFKIAKLQKSVLLCLLLRRLPDSALANYNRVCLKPPF